MLKMKKKKKHLECLSFLNSPTTEHFIKPNYLNKQNEEMLVNEMANSKSCYLLKLKNQGAPVVMTVVASKQAPEEPEQSEGACRVLQIRSAIDQQKHRQYGERRV